MNQKNAIRRTSKAISTTAAAIRRTRTIPAFISNNSSNSNNSSYRRLALAIATIAAIAIVVS